MTISISVDLQDTDAHTHYSLVLGFIDTSDDKVVQRVTSSVIWALIERNNWKPRWTFWQRLRWHLLALKNGL
jgi:hypothetical protein